MTDRDFRKEFEGEITTNTEDAMMDALDECRKERDDWIDSFNQLESMFGLEEEEIKHIIKKGRDERLSIEEVMYIFNEEDYDKTDFGGLYLYVKDDVLDRLKKLREGK